jgi:GNAT superfamily N-acetyltransferase
VKHLSLQIEEHPNDDDLRQLVDGVRSYNRALTGQERPRAVAAILRDEEGNIVGGAYGELWGASVHIAAMWVAEEHRGKRYGSALLTSVEEYAAKHAHLLSYLETTSFQARPFYERLGYTVFGELPGIAPGCTLFFLRKDLKTPQL